MREITITEEQYAKLEWAFSQINEIMMANNLAVLRSKKLPMVMTYLGEDE